MNRSILVCCGTGCIANGSLAVADALRVALAGTDVAVEATGETEVKETGCNGFCENGPILRVMPDDISYYKVKPEDAADIAASIGAEPLERLLYRDDNDKPVLRQADNPFYAPQHKIVLRNIGQIDPQSIADYTDCGGYRALERALQMTPEAIISEVEASGLRGRGGAGYPTGSKWRAAMQYGEYPKYVICNGDEGDPGAFMDRSTLEGDPHCVLEGMAICALAIGAQEGFLYIRDEYELALKHVTKAIRDAEEAGILGDSIMGSGKKLRLAAVRGGGAFVCGESTALMASIEGRVGEPRAKYVRSAQRGLWDKPTVLNNVETFANIPVIIGGGGENFALLGTDSSKGTKVFALVGKVKRTGLVEVPMGVTLRRLIFDIGGGIVGDRPFKAVQTGGPSGGCIPEKLLDLPVDFDTLTDYGAMMGSGGMIVMDDRSCMVEVARYYTNFLAEESCGKCAPCREGLRQMLSILTGICEGRGLPGDLEALEEICALLIDSSLCALGKTAANPVLTTIEHFRDEYNAHILEKRCPGGVCRELTGSKKDGTGVTSSKAGKGDLRV
ncbi:MAG: NAD(P)H-dependent oxidoreductase subunit E [Oscillospiraceae bacterium]|nr:NAD(P)H-dependent oxidoreductase subunit E [Oscillospiraceae bacterium]